MRLTLSAMIMLLVAACASNPNADRPLHERYMMFTFSDLSPNAVSSLYESAMERCWMAPGGFMENYELVAALDAPRHEEDKLVHLHYVMRRKADPATAKPLVLGVMGKRERIYTMAIINSSLGKDHPFVAPLKQAIRENDNGKRVCGMGPLSETGLSTAPEKLDAHYATVKLTPAQAETVLQHAFGSCWTAPGAPLENYRMGPLIKQTTSYGGLRIDADYALTGPDGQNYALTIDGFTGRHWSDLGVKGLAGAREVRSHPAFVFMYRQFRQFKKTRIPPCQTEVMTLPKFEGQKFRPDDDEVVNETKQGTDDQAADEKPASTLAPRRRR